MKKFLIPLITSMMVTAFSVQSFSEEISTEIELETTSELENYTPDGTRSNPYRLGDTISINAYGYDGNSVEYSIVFNDFWDGDKVKEEYPTYNFNNPSVAARGNMSILSASTDNAVNLNITTYFISPDMNEIYSWLEPYSSGTLNNQISNVYSGGNYDFILMSEDLTTTQDIAYIKIDYFTDASFNKETIWISIKDIAPISDEKNELAKLQDQIDNLEAEIARLKKLLDEAGIRYDDSSEPSTETSEIDEQDGFTTVELGELVSLDFTEFTIDGWGQGEELYPDNPTGYYHYMPDKENQSYFYAWGTLKNSSGNSFEFSNTSLCSVTFDDKYNYGGELEADEGGDFSYIYAYLDPLVSEKFYIIVSIPDDLANSFSTAEVKFAFMENFEDNRNANVRQEDYTYRYKTIITK